MKGFPIHDALSAVSPNNPVLLKHASGHGALANAKAMELRGITRRSLDPPGGEIVKDASGHPTGMFLENAQRLVDPEPRAANAGLLDLITRFPGGEGETRRRARLAAEEALSKGITTFHDAGASFETIDVLKKMVEANEMPLRLWVMIAEPNEALAQHLAQYKILGAGNHHLTVRAIKRVMDGALGSRGAWLLEPYTDLPASTGLNTETVASVEETARLAAAQGFQLCVHAIGDRANREVLDLFQRAFAADPGKPDRRWRIEHAQHLHPQDIPLRRLRGGLEGLARARQARRRDGALARHHDRARAGDPWREGPSHDRGREGGLQRRSLSGEAAKTPPRGSAIHSRDRAGSP